MAARLDHRAADAVGVLQDPAPALQDGHVGHVRVAGADEAQWLAGAVQVHRLDGHPGLAGVGVVEGRHRLRRGRWFRCREDRGHWRCHRGNGCHGSCGLGWRRVHVRRRLVHLGRWRVALLRLGLRRGVRPVARRCELRRLRVTSRNGRGLGPVADGEKQSILVVRPDVTHGHVARVDRRRCVGTIGGFNIRPRGAAVVTHDGLLTHSCFQLCSHSSTSNRNEPHLHQAEPLPSFGTGTPRQPGQSP